MKKVTAMKLIYNWTGGSISLPDYGILRTGKSVLVPATLVNTHDYQLFINAGKIGFTEKPIAQAAPNKPHVHRPKAPKSVEEETEQKTAKNKRAKNDKTIKRLVSDDESGEDNDGGIVFVDVQQEAERIASHPLLGKKK